MSWNLKRVLLLAGVLVALAVAAKLAGLPRYREWRDRRSLALAQACFAKSDFRGAALAARQVLVAERSNVEACRLMANLTESLRSPAALEWRQRVAEFQPGNLTNQLQLARTAALLGHFTLAAKALDAIPSGQRDHPAYLQLTALLALARNDPGEAGLQLTEAARLDPENKQIRLNLAVLDLQSTNAALTDAALKSLRELATLPEFRADALRQLTLAAIRDSDWANALASVNALRATTNALLDDRLLHLLVLKRSGNAEFAGTLAELEKACQASGAQASTLAVWLVANGQADEAARWLASLPEPVQARLEVKLARADCAMIRKDWQGLQELLKSADWGESEFLRHAMLSRAARELGGEIGAQAEWRMATRAAADRARSLALLARIAATWSWQREHEEVLWLLVQRHPGERWALEALGRSYLASGNTPGLQKIYTELVARNPDDLAARNNLAVTCLLLNLQLDRAHDLARSVYLRATNNAIFASTYAYSLYLQDRPKEGMAVLEKFPPAELEQPSVALYYGALQSAVAPEKAKKSLDLAEKGSLLPEEKVLLETARKRL